MSWILVDDLREDAQSFADAFGSGSNAIEVQVITAKRAREELLTDALKPAGVLMDVDLSSESGERGSGPGIAQDIRVKQKAGAIGEFPIVRFAARLPIQKNIKGDPGSDDLFDLKILKEEVSNEIDAIRIRLVGLEGIYAALSSHKNTSAGMEGLLGLDGELLRRWSDERFHERILSAVHVATHVAAGAFMRSFLTPTGLLIDERVLAVRLGVDVTASGQTWRDLRDALPFEYSGLGCNAFRRWWARGLDDWWFDAVKSDRPLVSLNIAERIETLSGSFGKLAPFKMPSGSAGMKPWRLCALALESDPPEFTPVDPAESVRLTPISDQALWTDPLSVSLGLALQKRDLRLNRSDVERLQRKHAGSTP
jgi:hypothetical protein